MRIKLGDQVFDGKAFLITDKAESDAVFEVNRKKLPTTPITIIVAAPMCIFFAWFLPDERELSGYQCRQTRCHGPDRSSRK